jgi:hypothetical protein
VTPQLPCLPGALCELRHPGRLRLWDQLCRMQASWKLCALLQLQGILSSNTEQVAELQAMVQQIQESVQNSLSSFTSGECTASELQERLMSAGVQVTCRPEQLENIRADPQATYAPAWPMCLLAVVSPAVVVGQCMSSSSSAEKRLK